MLRRNNPEMLFRNRARYQCSALAFDQRRARVSAAVAGIERLTADNPPDRRMLNKWLDNIILRN